MVRASTFTDERKLEIALELLSKKMSHAEVCHKRDRVFSEWRQRLTDTEGLGPRTKCRVISNRVRGFLVDS